MKAVMLEGFWAGPHVKEENLPSPVPDPDFDEWKDREKFLHRLDVVEEHLARQVSYRGWSNCRLCGCNNGSKEYTYNAWTWPEGFRHYITAHRVRPSKGFEAMILNEIS